MRPLGEKSKLASLTPEQKDEVASWLLDENLSLAKAAERVSETFNFPITRQAMWRFWHRECVPRKLMRAAETAKSVQIMAGSAKANWQDASAALLGQRIFETLASPEVDLKVVTALGAMLEKLKTRTLNEKAFLLRRAAEKRRENQQERQMAFAREKFEFDAVEAALAHAPAIRTITADGKLSGDEKREQLRRLLFPQAFETSST